MRSLKFLAVTALVLGLVGLSGAFSVAQDKKADAPKFTVKEVMKGAQANGLWKKAAEGKADKEEVGKLVEYYTAMAAAKAKKGEEAGWKEKTGAIVAAIKEVAAGKEGAGDKLKKTAGDCKGCHSVYK